MDLAYFNNICEEIINVILTAQNEIVVAMAWFTNEDLLNALTASQEKGVNVRIVILDDAINWMPYAPDFNKLIKAGAEFYVAPISIGFMHHKFCIIDNKKIITGSYNWTYYAEHRNLENIIISEDKNVSSDYNIAFEQIVKNLSIKDNVTKLELENITNYTTINIDEINNEIETISRVRNLPSVQQIVKPQSVVQIIDRKKKAISRLYIGMFVDKEWVDYIRIGDELPANRTNNEPLYLSPENWDNLKMTILYSDEKDNQSQIISKTLSGIADKSKLDSEVKIRVSLSKEGIITCEVHSVKTGKSIVATQIVPNSVKYE